LSLNYDLHNPDDIYKGETFTLMLNDNSSLPDHFQLVLKCSDCSSFYKLSKSKYQGVINREGTFDVGTYVEDKETSETRLLKNKKFYIKKVLVNATPEMTVTEWAVNVSSRDGFNLQTKWDYTGYMNGYGSTEVTKLFYVNEVSNNGSSAVVEIKYHSYDSGNGNKFELVQRLHLTNYGANTGWKWDAKENHESVIVL
jgi:hypothetical protein